MDNTRLSLKAFVALLSSIPIERRVPQGAHRDFRGPRGPPKRCNPSRSHMVRGGIGSGKSILGLHSPPDKPFRNSPTPTRSIWPTELGLFHSVRHPTQSARRNPLNKRSSPMVQIGLVLHPCGTPTRGNGANGWPPLSNGRLPSACVNTRGTAFPGCQPRTVPRTNPGSVPT